LTPDRITVSANDIRKNSFSGCIRDCSSQLDRHDRPLCHRSSARFLEQFPADQPAANFGCASTDVIKLRIAKKAARGEFVDVAVATEALDCLERHPHAFLRRIENGTG